MREYLEDEGIEISDFLPPGWDRDEDAAAIAPPAKRPRQTLTATARLSPREGGGGRGRRGRAPRDPEASATTQAAAAVQAAAQRAAAPPVASAVHAMDANPAESEDRSNLDLLLEAAEEIDEHEHSGAAQRGLVHGSPRLPPGTHRKPHRVSKLRAAGGLSDQEAYYNVVAAQVGQMAADETQLLRCCVVAWETSVLRHEAYCNVVAAQHRLARRRLVGGVAGLVLL